MAENISESINVPRFFFTEPWEPVIVRRGDALGLSALADQFADAVAPDFSNRIRDGRWVTILAWCLVQSQQVFHASGGRSVSTRKEQNERYAWLRPLELMWVARTITLLEKSDWKQRSLAGQRRVAPWVQKQSIERFGMSPEQFRAYRQTGMYGGYRLAFRKWPGMTSGDGWTPGKKSIALAKWMDSKLKGAKWPPKPSEELVRVPKVGSGKECGWWLSHWNGFDQSGKDADVSTLPRRKDDFKVLPEAEILKPIMFGDDLRGKDRVKVLRLIQKSTATNHLELCKHLSSEFKNDPVIARLYSFSRLADAGIAVMDMVAEVLRDQPEVAIKEIALHKNATAICKELKLAAVAWCKAPELPSSRIKRSHLESAHRFAEAITSEKSIDCLRAVLEHHRQYGGGLRWFELKNGKVEARTLPKLGSSSRYGFRLWSLCRLATQCGVLKKMPVALSASMEDEDEYVDEGNDNEQ